MSSFSSGFDEMDTMFLEFTEDLDNPVGGPSSMGDNSGESNNGIHFNLRLFNILTQDYLNLFLTLYILIIYSAGISQSSITPTPRRRA